MKVMEVAGRWDLDALRPNSRPEPALGAFDVLIAMEAASVNYRDWVLVHGGYGRRGGTLPVIPVSDGAGRVVAVGSSVTRFKIGDRVCPNMAQTWIDGPLDDSVASGMLGGPLPGVLQERLAMPESGLVKAASHLDAAAAASLPCAALTAWNAVAGRIKPGDIVLTQGTGGVSLFALQFAKLGGARVIITSSSDDKLARARQLGADETLNYRTHPDWEKRALDISGGGVDLVVELAGTLESSLRAVKAGGEVALIGVLAGASPPLPLGQIVIRR